MAVKWTNERLRICLLGAPRFRFHKSQVPFSNNVKANVPLRIEKWIMEIQDEDYELVYEPGKDETHPIGFLFRHPLPETEDGKTEKIIR